MTRSTWDTEEMLRRLSSPRRLVSWLLLAILVAGAASYLHGSRYRIVPAHGTFSSTAYQDPLSSSLPAATAFSSGETLAQTPRAVRATPQVSWAGDAKVPQQECCERRSAPRSEPVPLRTGVLDPPVPARLPDPAGGLLSALAPPEPDLHPLTALQLSISRT